MMQKDYGMGSVRSELEFGIFSNDIPSDKQQTNTEQTFLLPDKTGYVQVDIR